MIFLLARAGLRGSLGGATFSGATISCATSGSVATAKLIINQDGTTDKNECGSITQINDSTDWLLPKGSPEEYYEIRYTNFTGDALAGATTLTEDVWAPMDQDHEMILLRTVPEGVGTDSCTFDMQVRRAAGDQSVLSTASYTLNATKNP